jgi:anti-sigma B factor antagonist
MSLVELDLKLEPSGADMVMWAVGALDLYTAPKLRASMLEVLVGRSDPFRVTLDMGGVDFVDSSGLGVLVAVLKRLRFLGGDLVLRAPSLSLSRLLEITGLDRVFTVNR